GAARRAGLESEHPLHLLVGAADPLGGRERKLRGGADRGELEARCQRGAVRQWYAPQADRRSLAGRHGLRHLEPDLRLHARGLLPTAIRRRSNAALPAEQREYVSFILR